MRPVGTVDDFAFPSMVIGSDDLAIELLACHGGTRSSQPTPTKTRGDFAPHLGLLVSRTGVQSPSVQGIRT
jgi:hypothetical protein